MLAVQISLTLVALWLVRCLWRRWRYDLHKIPTPPGLPFLGQTMDFLKGGLEGDFMWLLGHYANTLGHPKLVRVSLMGSTLLFVNDMSCYKKVVVSAAAPLDRRVGDAPAVVSLIGRPPVGKGLLQTSALTPHVKTIRQIYASAFSSGSLSICFTKANACVDALVAEIEARRTSGPIEFQDLCTKLTLDAIGVVAMGVNLGGLDGSRDIHRLLIEVGRVGIQRQHNLWANLKVALLPLAATVQKEDRTIAALHAEWDRLAGEVLAREDPPAGEEPIWHGLKKAIDADTGKPISRPLLAYELGTLVVGGMDTTGHQISWILACLASRPHIVEKLLEELREKGLYGPNARDPNFEDLGELPYLTAVIKEGMRYVSVFAGGLPRTSPKDMTLMGYRIPKGTVIMAIGNRWSDSAEDWGDPEVFRPERWLSGEDMSQKFYIGFSYGTRDCPGRSLAMMEMRLALIRLVTKYTLSLTVPFEQLKLEARQSFVIEACNGVWINVAPRKE